MQKQYWNGLIIGLALALVAVLYLYHVTNLLKQDAITNQCNMTSSNYTRSSTFAFYYAVNPIHWSNLSNYMSTTCLIYQNLSQQYNLLYVKRFSTRIEGTYNVSDNGSGWNVSN